MEEINLKEMFMYFWSKKFWIIGVIILFTIIGVVYDMFCTVPIYASSTSLIFTKIEFENEADANSYYKIVEISKEIAKSKKVARKTIENLKIDINLREFIENLNFTAVTNSQTLWIEVYNVSGETAAKIANEIAKITLEELENIYGDVGVQVLDVATANSTPYNENALNNVFKFIMLGIVLILGYFMVRFMFLNSTKNKEKNI